MTFLWKPYADQGSSSSILTHIFQEDYGYPDGFKYEMRLYENDPIIVNKTHLNYNVDKKCAKLLNFSNQVYNSGKG